MKLILATLVALSFIQQAQAQFQAKDLNFAAPIVYGDPAPTNSKVGSIIYDLNTNAFRGLYADGTWGNLPAAFKAPTVQRFTSGSGTYTTPADVKYIIVEMIGGGMGGSGSSTRIASDGGIGGSGNNSTFGTILTAGGAIQSSVYAGNPGGTPTVNSPAIDIGSYQGAAGTACETDPDTTSSGGTGGGLGGGRGTHSAAASPGSGAANTGGGGGGASAPINGSSGSGGGAGALVKAMITSPASTYSYSVGTGGSGGTAGTSGTAGAAGGSGVIIVTEYYQ